MPPPQPLHSAAPVYQPAASVCAQGPAPAQPPVQQASPRSSAPIWAIAASLLIATGVGGYAMRDKIFGAPADADTVVVATDANKIDTAKTTDNGKVAVVAANPAAANPGVDKTGATDPAAPSDAANTGTSAPDTGATATANQAESSTPSSDVAKVNTGQSAELADINAELERVKAENARLAAAADSAQANPEVEATPRAPLAGLRSRIEAVNDKRDLNPRVATNTPSPSVGTSSDAPMVSRVVVISIGETGPAGAAENLIEDALRDGGYTVVDEDAFPALAALRGRGTMPMILAAAKRAGISAAVIVRVQKTGTQDLEFYGQRDTRTLATLEVKAFSVATGASINNFREEIGYTGLNAADNGRIAVEEHLGQLLAQLSAHRGRG